MSANQFSIKILLCFQWRKNSGAGGAGAKVSPSAILVIQNGTSKIINIKDKDSLNKLIELIPDIINKLTGVGKGKKNEVEISEATEVAEASEAASEETPKLEDYI